METRSIFRRGDDIYVDVVPQKVTDEMRKNGYAIDSQIRLSLKDIQQLEDLPLRPNAVSTL